MNSFVNAKNFQWKLFVMQQIFLMIFYVRYAANIIKVFSLLPDILTQQLKYP